MKRTPTTLLLVALLASFARASDLEDALALKAQGKFDDALPKFEAAVKADPTNPAASLGLSQVLAGLGRYEQAAKAVDAARKAHPENAALLVAKGRAYLLLALKEADAEEPDGSKIDGYAADAARWGREAQKTDPKSADAMVLRAQVAKQQGDKEQYRTLLEDAVKADPKNFDANYELATWWFDKSREDKSKEVFANAERCYAAALAADPKSAAAAANVAHCMAWRVAPAKDVAAAYLKALELAPTDESLLGKAIQWTPPEDKVAVAQKLADAMPKDSTRKIYLAFALQQAQQYQKAAEVLDDASKFDPQNPYIPLNEGDVALAAGRTPDAVLFYVESVQLFKAKGSIDDRTYLRLAASIAFQSKALKLDQRETIWQALWKCFPGRPDAAANAGLFYRDAVKDYKSSIEWYMRAAKVAQDDAAVQNDTGCVLDYYLHEPEKAEPFYRRSIDVGEAKGYDWNAPALPGVGYRDSLNNLGKLLAGNKRWKDLAEFCEKHLPEAHPMRDVWLKLAKEKK